MPLPSGHLVPDGRLLRYADYVDGYTQSCRYLVEDSAGQHERPLTDLLAPSAGPPTVGVVHRCLENLSDSDTNARN